MLTGHEPMTSVTTSLLFWTQMLAGSFVVLPFLVPEHFLTQMNGVETGI